MWRPLRRDDLERARRKSGTRSCDAAGWRHEGSWRLLETGEPRIVVGQSDATLRITSFTAPVVGELVRAELASPGEARRVLGEVTVVLWCSSDLAMVLAHLVDDPAA